MIAIVIFALKLLDKNVDIGAVVIIIAMFLATILAIIYLLIRQMSRVKESPALRESTSEEYQPPKGLGAAHTNQLEEPHQAPASVTEQTTRSFEKIGRR